jgi:CheY-like chemotaxis protein
VATVTRSRELDRLPAERRVLVVDDDPECRASFVQLLTFSGCAVREAANGRTALEICRTWNPSVVITDYQMPIMNGPQLVAAIEADRMMAHTLVVMVTGSTIEPSLLPRRVNKLVIKPVSADALSTLLELIASE